MERGSYLLEVGKADRGKYATCSAGKLILNKRSLIETHLPTYKIKKEEEKPLIILLVMPSMRRNVSRQSPYACFLSDSFFRPRPSLVFVLGSPRF